MISIRWTCMVGWLLFFAAIFAVFPLNGVLPGTTDVLCHITAFHEHLKWLREAVLGQDMGWSFYPEQGIHRYLELYWGQSAIFHVFATGLGLSDVWSAYGLLVVLYALNAWAVFAFVHVWVGRTGPAVLAGTAFAASAFLLGQYELHNSLGFFPVPLSLLLLRRWTRTRSGRHLIGSVFWLFLTPFFSGYAAFLGGFTWVSYALTIGAHRGAFHRPLPVLFSGLLAAVMISPMAARVLFLSGPEVIDPMVHFSWVERDGFALSSIGLISALPGHLFYPTFTQSGLDQVVRIPYHVFPGFLVLVLAITGIRPGGRMAVWSVLIGSFGLVLAMNIVPLGIDLFRIPGRGFLLTQFAVAVLAGIGLNHLMPRIGHGWHGLAMIVACAIVAFENVPFGYRPLAHPMPMQAPALFDAIPEERAVVACLPSSLFTRSGYRDGLSEFNREYMYAYWQLQHGHDVVNGSAGFLSTDRLEWVDILGTPRAVEPEDLPSEIEYLLICPKLSLDSMEHARTNEWITRSEGRVLARSEEGVLIDVRP